MTSSFGEYRSGHVHAGVDIKTWGKTGYQVFAVDNGSIVRVRVSPFGYGRVIYQLLENGMTVIYAHLSAFCDTLESIVADEQDRERRFSVDKWIKSGTVPVRRGELIGYTGRSGSRDPHLHFEIRDADNHPVNPLALGFAVEDDRRPRASSVVVTPVLYGSHVDGDFQPKRYPLKRSGLSYLIPDSIVVWGGVGVSVAAYDLCNAATNRYAPYELKLFVDEIPVFTVRYDRFPYSRTRDVELDRDYRLRAWGWGSYHKLYREPGNQLPFYEPSGAWAGLIQCREPEIPGHGDSERHVPDGHSIDPGSHSMRIAIADFYGNQTDILGTLVMMPLVETQDGAGEPVEDGALPMNWSGADIRLERTFFENFVHFRLQSDGPLSRIPSLWIETEAWDGELVPLLPSGSREFAGIWQWKSGLDGPVVTEVRFTQPFGQSRTVQDTMWVTDIARDNGGLLQSRDGRMKVTFDPGSVYASFLSYCVEEPYPGSAVAGTMYRVYPTDVPLKQPAVIRIALPAMVENSEKLGIYSLNNRRPVYVGGDRIGSELSARTLELGCFTVLEDTVAPVFLNIIPPDGAVLREPPRVAVSFRDSLSGVSGEENMLLWIDNERRIVEYDPFLETLFPVIRSALGPGEHTLQVFLKDRAGNFVLHESTFTLSRP